MQTIPISIQQGGQSIPLSVSGGGTDMDLTPEQLRVVEAVSPKVDAERVEGGVEITVHDLRGTQTVELRDGERGETGEAGPQGVPGVSPMATVTQTATGAIVTVTDEQGTTTAEIKNGQDGTPGSPGAPGTDGISPTISVTDIAGGHRVTITDADGARSFDVMDGDDYVLTAQDKADIAAEVDVPVQDVHVNGVSVLRDGVANVPVASANDLGVVKVTNQNRGLYISSGDVLSIAPAGDSTIKSGAEYYKPISSARQHISTFYGLAKAAGSNMASSSNPVGTYTDEAKVAIQKMLGIYEPPWELLNDITLTEEGRFDLTADDNGTPYDLLGVLIRVYYDKNLTSASTGYGRYVCKDSSGVTINAETGKYATQTSMYAKFIYILRDGPMAIAVFSRATSTGGTMTWTNKHFSGVQFNFKNIQRIYLNTEDVEPAGTRIQIYGQRAY